MRTIYVGSGQGNYRKRGIKWKLYLFLFFFLALTVSILKVTGPTIVERWINRNGAGTSGYAYSIRDVELSLAKGKMILSDVKVFHPKSNTELIEAPNLTIQLNWSDLISSQEKKISIFADQVDLNLSKDFSSELARIDASGKPKKDVYLDALDGKIGKLNIIEQKNDESRTVIELNDVNLKVKEFTPHSINKKTEFSLSSRISEGGELKLSGKTTQEKNETPWSIQGSLKNVPADLLNKIAGDKLPFSFLEPSLNAEISAHSENGQVSGEILPAIRKLNLVEEKPGIPSRSIARILNEELTFTLPFTLKDEFDLQYAETYARLKNYRKSGPIAGPESATTAEPAKQKTSFWPF